MGLARINSCVKQHEVLPNCGDRFSFQPMKFLSRLAGLVKKQDMGHPAPLRPTFVVGDVHGRHDLLKDLLDDITAVTREEGLKDPVTVLTGDYIDRGPDGAAVLRTLFETQKTKPDALVCLRGNHEVMMLDWLDDPSEYMERWIFNGGLDTMASFGVSPDDGPVRNVVSMMHNRLGPSMERWLRNLPSVWSSGNLWVVHAGADPRLPMEAQTDQSLLWGHARFLSTPRGDGVWVAHGHTITDEARLVSGRIQVDTGAYYSGKLSAMLVRPDGSVRVLEALDASVDPPED